MTNGNAKLARDYRSLKEVMPYMAELRLLTFCANIAAPSTPIKISELECFPAVGALAALTIGKLTRFFAHQTIIRNTGPTPVKVVGVYEGRVSDGFYIPTNHPPGVQLNWGYNPAEVGLLTPDGTGQIELLFMAEIVVPK